MNIQRIAIVFATLEESERSVEDIRAFFRPLR
jgi:hypothetical protein